MTHLGSLLLGRRPPALRRPLAALGAGLDLLELRASTFAVAEKGGERADRRALEHLHDGEFLPERLAQARVDLNHQQRVAAGVEEVVVDAEPLDLQDLPPDFGDDALDLRA